MEKWCASCANCSARKSPPTPRAPLLLEDSVSRPLERIAMDILGKGKSLIGDYFTRWKEVFPMKDMDAIHY